MKFHLSGFVLFFATIFSFRQATCGTKEGKYDTVPMSGAYFEEQDVDLYDTVAPIIFKLKRPDWLDQFPMFLGYPCNSDKYAEATLCPVFYYMYKQLSRQLETAMEVPSTKLPVTDMDIIFDCDKLSKHFMSFRLKESRVAHYLERLRKCTENKIYEGELQHPEESVSASNSSSFPKFRSVYDKMVSRFMEEYHNRLPEANRENKASELNHRLALTSIVITHLTALGNRWSGALSDCKSGFVPEALVSPERLTEALNSLEKLVSQEQFNFKFSIPYEGPQVSRYYKAPLADCVMTEQVLYIRILVPIVKKRKTAASLIKIKSTPFHSQSDVHQLCMIRGFEKGRYFNLGVQAAGSITVSQAMEVTCDTSNFKLCKIPPPLENVVDTTTDCARALITYDFSQSEDAKVNVISACTLDCNSLDVEKLPMVIKSKDAVSTVYLIMNPDDSKEGMFLDCEKKDDNMILKPPVTGVLAIQIPCRCKVVLKDMTIHPVMTTCKSDFTVANAVPLHWEGQNTI
jgi:hypothetical protein